MKRVVKIFVMIFLFAIVSCAEAKPRLSVRTFEDRSEDGKAPANAVMDMMVTELNKADVFDLIERERIDYIAEEMKLSEAGLLRPDTALEVGQLLGVQYTMTGAITLYYYNENAKGFMLPVIGKAAQTKTAYVVLEIRIINNLSGKIIYTSEQLGSSNREAKGNLAGYKGFFIGGYKRTYGGILAAATRDAVIKHVAAIKAHDWEE